MFRKLTEKILKEGCERKDFSVLAQAITCCESSDHEDQKLIQDFLEQKKVSKVSKSSSWRIGVSGTPGVGKSTFIENFVPLFLEQGRSPAVLAIDPSSLKTGGSLLGDKTRMPKLAAHPNCFVRPSSSQGGRGGVTATTFLAIELCERFGRDLIVVETLGVGQSEFDLDDLCDCFLFLCQPGSGDELQAIKKGVLEYVDFLVVNKNDGALTDQAESTYRGLQDLIQSSDRISGIYKTSSVNQSGLSEVAKCLSGFFQGTKNAKRILEKRATQGQSIYKKLLAHQIVPFLEQHPKYSKLLQGHIALIKTGKSNPFRAVQSLLDNF